MKIYKISILVAINDRANDEDIIDLESVFSEELANLGYDTNSIFKWELKETVDHPDCPEEDTDDGKFYNAWLDKSKEVLGFNNFTNSDVQVSVCENNVEPKQIAFVVTFDSSKITKGEAVEHIENIKFELNNMILDEVPKDKLIIDGVYEPVFVDYKYDDWN